MSTTPSDKRAESYGLDDVDRDDFAAWCRTVSTGADDDPRFKPVWDGDECPHEDNGDSDAS